MNIYSVYVDSSKKKREPMLIRQGFSFVAAIFSFFWAIYHKMWITAIIAFIFSTVTANTGNLYITYSGNIAILFVFGFFAGELREYYATKTGFRLSDVILAHDEEDAEARFYMRAEG